MGQLCRAPISNLHTVHASHLDQDATTLTLHDRHRTRRPGFATDCGIYTVPSWARPFLLAAANLVHLCPRGDDSLFFTGPPRALPYLTDFAEHCRLRPPQPRPALAAPPDQTQTGRPAQNPVVQRHPGVQLRARQLRAVAALGRMGTITHDTHATVHTIKRQRPQPSR
ncbi:hypothetical protein [Streptomyces sp. CA-106131]|uniref:hypothetical protein n=1 Tax=Streptomyces sp. CA-106131 TaxID=3240045 RepID=UPI003D8E85D5